MNVCDYANCDTFAIYPDDGWLFCWQHYLEHRADLHGEPWPQPVRALGTTLWATVDDLHRLRLVEAKAAGNTGDPHRTLCITTLMQSGRTA